MSDFNPVGDLSQAATLAAMKMRQAYLALRDEWKKESPEFAQTGMGVGISTGKVTTGTVGPIFGWLSFFVLLVKIKAAAQTLV